ncbi:MAG: hypothetical protein PHV82_08250 [Victivallaceae bacterium]|nr:hypothetical protein [Victivallaceae bacterium]
MKNKILILTVALACFISALHIFFCIDVYDDIAAWYAPMTRAFARGEWNNAFTLSVPVLNSTLAGIFSWLGMEPFRALVLVSCLFYLASIPVLFQVLKYFLKHDDYAAWGCFLYVVAPKIIRYSCTGLLNPAKNFFMIAAVALILAAAKRLKWITTLLMGIVSAGLALARAETVIFLPLLVLWYAYFIFADKGNGLRERFFRMFAHCLVITLVFFICVSPRLYQSYKLTGVPALDIRQADYICEVLPFHQEPYSQQLIITVPQKTEVSKPKFHGGWEMIWQGMECFVRGSYSLYLVLALFGIYLWWKRKENRPEAFMLFSIVIINFAVLIGISNSIRYYTINSIILLPFTFITVKSVWDSLSAGKSLKFLAVFLMTAIVVLQVINGIKKTITHEYDFEYRIGHWIRHGKKPPAAGRRLIIAATQPQYSFWADAVWMNIPKDRLQFAEQLALIRKADFVVLGREQLEALAILRVQKEFKRLKQINERAIVFVNSGERQ